MQNRKIIAPSIGLINPKFLENLANVKRNAACFGINQVWFTGNRLNDQLQADRLPRPLRIKDYQYVKLVRVDKVVFPLNAIPVAIEFKNGFIPLNEFNHPENAVYIFGSEDGSLLRKHFCGCHHFVTIPSRFCLNLAQSVGIVLYDRFIKNE